MNLKTLASAAIMAAGLAGITLAPAAYADMPKLDRVKNVAEMDTNKNGRIERGEYLSFMGNAFDKAAGAKGYCTFEEIAEGFKSMTERYGIY